MALAPHSRMGITTIQEEKEQEKPGQEERVRPRVGEVTARIRYVGTERVMLDDGTVLGLPHFLLSQTSELIKVGTILKAKYEYRNGGKAVAFIEVSQNWPDPGSCFRSSLIRAPVGHE